MVEIKPVKNSQADAAVLAELGERTFSQTFAKDNTPENLALYLSRTFGPELQLRELGDSRRRTAIAWVDGQAVGYSQLLADSREPSVKGSRPIELVRLYVDAERLGQGVGAALMNRCLSQAKAEGFETLWLGVWERNFRAQAFYKKYDFKRVGEHEFVLGNDVQIDWILSRAL